MNAFLQVSDIYSSSPLLEFITVKCKTVAVSSTYIVKWDIRTPEAKWQMPAATAARSQLLTLRTLIRSFCKTHQNWEIQQTKTHKFLQTSLKHLLELWSKCWNCWRANNKLWPWRSHFQSSDKLPWWWKQPEASLHQACKFYPSGNGQAWSSPSPRGQ